MSNAHRHAHAELREGMAALNRVNGARMPQPATKIVIERSPYPNTEPQYRWTAYYEDREDELSKSGMTPDQALSRFLIAVTNRDEPELP